MKKKITAIFLTIIPFLTFAQENLSIDEQIEKGFKPIADFFTYWVFYPIHIAGMDVPIVIIILLLGALYFTIYNRFANIRLLGVAIRAAKGKYDDIDHHVAETVAGDSTPNDDGDSFETIQKEGVIGEVTHFQALTAALSATVGLGNIAGVAVAIAIGGPGATLWMILAGFIGMSSKLVEATLGVKYREVGEDGKIYGGPMYYLTKGLKENNMTGLGKFLAVFFAIMVVGGSFGGGNMFQANQAAAQFKLLFNITSGNGGFLFGLALAAIVGLVIIGGIKRIGKVTERVVPFMAIIYVGAALVIVFMNFSYIPDAFAQIWNGAFNASATVGGFIGVMIVGFQRAAFSNEAGVGSASIAHAAVKTRFPASEGIVASIGPFVDTVIICTMSAMVIVIMNLKNDLFNYGDVISKKVLLNATGERVGGVDLTSVAFDAAIPNFSVILTIAVILFAFSTLLSWSYYGLQGWYYLFGRTKVADYSYKLLFLFFVIVGSSISLGSVIDFSDAMIFAMVFPNIIGLIILAPKVRSEIKRYLKAIGHSDG